MSEDEVMTRKGKRPNYLTDRYLRNRLPRKEAYLDIDEWHLWLLDVDGKDYELKWNEDWPETIDADFLRTKGFVIVS